MAKGTTKIKIPTNYAHSRSISPSAACMYSYNYEQPESKSLLKITELTSVGTISSYKDIKTDNGKSIENANVQTVDACYLPFEHDSLEMKFTVAFCQNSQTPHSCNEQEHLKLIRAFTEAYQERNGYEYLAKLYLDNLLEAKMLWRNALADDIYVSIKALRSEIPAVKQKDGSNYAELVKEIGRALSGERKRLVIEVTAGGWLGCGQEVYPSQEFTQKSSEKHAKSKTLARLKAYGEDNVASIHPQKIGNAIRQIDTWYDGFVDTQKALAIDPACVNKPEFKAYRLKTTKRDLYSLLEDNLVSFTEELKAAKSIEEVNVDIHFIMANLIRGGVFGGK